MSEQFLRIGVAIVKAVVEPQVLTNGEMTLEDRAKACFRSALAESSSWFTASDEEKFRIGCGALLLLSDGEERERVENTLRCLQALSAAMNGVPVDFASMFQGGPDDVVPLLPWFNEVRG